MLLHGSARASCSRRLCQCRLLGIRFGRWTIRRNGSTTASTSSRTWVSRVGSCSCSPVGRPSIRRRARVTAPLLVRALRGEPVERPPVWFMRQAGRSLPEYQALRNGRSLLQLARDPELTAEVTLQPVRRHGVDAAILFSDIVVPLAAVGVELEIRAGGGPVIAAPIRTAADVRRLRPLEPEEDLPEVAQAVRLLCAELDVPLIGFAGGPFTLASYLIEGGPSKTQAKTKAMMLGQPALFGELLDRLAAIAAASIRAQVRAGAAAVQIFESWVGFLSRAPKQRH